MTHLDLTCNRLTAVDGLGTMFNLEELKLASNQLSELPDLSRCKRVWTIYAALYPKCLMCDGLVNLNIDVYVAGQF